MVHTGADGGRCADCGGQLPFQRPSHAGATEGEGINRLHLDGAVGRPGFHLQPEGFGRTDAVFISRRQAGVGAPFLIGEFAGSQFGVRVKDQAGVRRRTADEDHAGLPAGAADKERADGRLFAGRQRRAHRRREGKVVVTRFFQEDGVTDAARFVRPVDLYALLIGGGRLEFRARRNIHHPLADWPSRGVKHQFGVRGEPTLLGAD